MLPPPPGSNSPAWGSRYKIQTQWEYALYSITLVKVALGVLDIFLNPIPTRLCHVIYCFGDKSYPCLDGIGLTCVFFSFILPFFFFALLQSNLST